MLKHFFEKWDAVENSETVGMIYNALALCEKVVNLKRSHLTVAAATWMGWNTKNNFEILFGLKKSYAKQITKF